VGRGEIAKVPVWRGLVPGRSIRFTLLFRTTITIGAASTKDIVSARRVATRHSVPLLASCPAKLRGIPYTGTSRSMPALGTGTPDHPLARAVIVGSPAPVHAKKAPGSEAVDGQDDSSQGIWEIGAQGIICPGQGTRASANTSGPDFTWGFGPGEIADHRSAPNEENLFLLPDRLRKSELFESDPAV
jgi:hypothetical protein